MPYIIEARRPATSPVLREAGCPDLITRTAVATLEEARRDLLGRYGRVLPHAAAFKVQRALEALPESGGTVGPLPDGTVIEVRPA